eukprot:1811919-Rhodomonas_salina.1
MGDVCQECWEDFWCPPGNISIPCHGRSTSPAGSSDISNCWCDAGYFGQKCEMCDRGFWCPPGPDRFPCPEYKSSPAGSSSEEDCAFLLDVNVISQTNPFYSCDPDPVSSAGLNTLRVSLKSLIPPVLGQTSAFTITGLAGVGQSGEL